jgi:hypothetical protein
VRFMLFLAAIISAGAVGVTQRMLPPPAQMARAVMALGGDFGQVRTTSASSADANNRTLPQILKGSSPDKGGSPDRGSSPDDLGFHGTAVTIPPGSFRGMNSGTVNVGQNGFAASALSQIQQTNNRVQDMAAYARNPAAWHGAPPH